MRLRGYSGYSDTSWFLRALRAVPVIAGAALIGGVVGGFAVFAINSAFTWESQPRPDNQTSDNRSSTNQSNGNQSNGSQPSADQSRALDQGATKPVKAVGGAIPDPSAGMSEPPPTPRQQQSSSAPAQPQISSQLLAPKPLGPAAQLATQSPPQTAAMTAPSATQTQGQTAITGTNQPSVQTQNAAATVQQRWPDAVSPAHQNASNATNAQQQTTPPPAIDQSASVNGRPKEADSNPISPDDQNNPNGFRQSRHSRHHTIAGTNGLRNEPSIAASSPRGQDARSYDRLYDSYGNRIDRAYGNAGQPYYGVMRGDQGDGGYRLDPRRYGRTAGYRTRPRVIMREQPPPFWGGGYYRGGYQDE
jgi:hypothetical protein